MERSPREISWKAPEHRHFERGRDWYIALVIVVVSATFATFLLGNFLFAIIVLLSGIGIGVIASQPPRTMPYAVSVRGVRVGPRFYPHGTLDSYTIDEEHRHGPHLLLMAKHRFSPLLVIPLPHEQIDAIDEILSERLPAGDLEEPLHNVLLEFLQF